MRKGYALALLAVFALVLGGCCQSYYDQCKMYMEQAKASADRAAASVVKAEAAAQDAKVPVPRASAAANKAEAAAAVRQPLHPGLAWLFAAGPAAAGVGEVPLKDRRCGGLTPDHTL